MKARGQQGRPHKCPWVRNAFFEWYTSVRYSIDWSKVRARPPTPGLSSCGMGKSHNYVINQPGVHHVQRDRHDHCRNYNTNMIQKLAKTVSCLRRGQKERGCRSKTFRASKSFDCVMNMGANTAPFIPKLVTFTRAWLNSEFKRLPLTAFKEASKITNDFPRTPTAWASSQCRKAPGRKSGKTT